MYYECDACGQMIRMSVERSTFVQNCPACEETTSWSPAFDGQGVSF